MLGETISHYRILEKLGQGGMGEVYLAEDTRLGRKVAIKFLTPELARDHESRARFRNEARAAAKLSHPNIATIHDIGEADGKLFLVLEYLQGQTLSERTAQGPLPIEDVVRIGLALSAGLTEAHAHGILHRDIKSSNVMLTGQTEVKILDFGLARHSDATQITRPGTTLGTVGYMSPEQSRGNVADVRSEVWSVGVVLYECLTGRLPFWGESATATLHMVQTQAPVPPSGIRTGVPLELEHVVTRCLEKEPDLRYQHLDDLGADLHRATRGISTGGLPKASTTQDLDFRPGPSRSKHWLRLAGALTVLVAVAITLGFFLWPRSTAEDMIVVIPVTSTDTGGELAARAIAEAVAIRLARSSDLHVVPTPEPGRLDAFDGDLTRAARELGASKLVRLELSQEGDRMTLRSVLIDVASDRILGGSEIHDDQHDLSRLAVLIADDLLVSQSYAATRKYDYVLYVEGGPEMVASDAWRQWQDAFRGSADIDESFVARLVEEFPEDPAAYAIHSMKVYGAWAGSQSPETRGRLDQLLAELDQLDPENPYTAIWRGIILRRQGRPREAIPVLTAVLDRSDLTDSCRSWVLRMRAFARREIGDAESAIEDAELAVRLDPAHGTNSYAIAAALRDAGRLDEALIRAISAEVLSPDEARMLVLTGDILLRMGRPVDALPHTSRACDLGDAAGCALFAVALQATGDFSGAGVARQRALQAGDTKEGAYYLACLEAQRADVDRAIELLEESLRLGFSDTKIETDPCFDALEQEPRFAGILEMVRERVR